MPAGNALSAWAGSHSRLDATIHVPAHPWRGGRGRFREDSCASLSSRQPPDPQDIGPRIASELPHSPFGNAGCRDRAGDMSHCKSTSAINVYSGAKCCRSSGPMLIAASPRIRVYMCGQEADGCIYGLGRPPPSDRDCTPTTTKSPAHNSPNPRHVEKKEFLRCDALYI